MEAVKDAFLKKTIALLKKLQGKNERDTFDTVYTDALKENPGHAPLLALNIDRQQDDASRIK